MKKSEIFKEELTSIQNEALKTLLTDYFDIAVPEYFWEVAASSTGKYHPWYSLGYGGLVRHTKAAVKIAIDLLSLEQNADLNKDEVIAALLIHDTVKHGTEGSEYTTFDHPFAAVELFSEFAIKSASEVTIDILTNITNMVSAHMGQWNIKDNIELPKPETKAEQFVHMCDYLASRKYITIEVI